MARTKNLTTFLVFLMLVITSFLFVACGGKDYSKTYLSSSSDYVEIFVDEEKTFSVTIEKPVGNMSGELSFTLSNPLICDIQKVSSNEFTTTYSVTGLQGGQGAVDFISTDGSKTKSVQIKVRQFADELRASDSVLYVSSSTELVPSSADFSYKEEVTERNLKYYFYGKTTTNGLLTLNDIKNEEEYINNFRRAFIYNVEADSYLIFVDEGENYYTLGAKNSIPGSGNTKYSFLSVDKNDDEFSFDLQQASKVDAGDEFTFIGIYDYENQDETLYCEKNFTVLNDIKPENISLDYGYKVEGVEFVKGADLTSYKPENASQSIVLIPGYSASILEGPLVGRKVNYVTAFIQITLQDNGGLLLAEGYCEDTNINSISLGTTTDEDSTTYYFQINCSTSRGVNTNFNVKFFYKGFSEVNDSNVNYNFVVPVEVKLIPNNLLLNNLSIDSVQEVYTFYNRYAEGSMFGWREFYFSVLPQGSEYDNLTIDLTNSNLKLKYKNKDYYNEIVTITDLQSPVYLKGIEEAQLTQGVENLPVSLNFSVMGNDSISSSIKFEIVKGASPLAYKTNQFKSNIYLDIRETSPVLFKDIFTDAKFEKINFVCESKIDVVDFIVGEEVFIQEGNNFYLNFSLVPRAIGTSTYTISIDNGEQITLKVSVEETLKNVSIVSVDEGSFIRYSQDSIVDENEFKTLYYVYNNANRAYFDVSVVAYDDRNSNAISSVVIANISNPILQIDQATNNNKNFNVNLIDRGRTVISLEINGYVIENFVRERTQILYDLDIVSYDYIKNLYAYKLSDGFSEEYAQNTTASYVNVYSNTLAENKRTFSFRTGIENQNAYLFFNPVNGSYVSTTFSESFVYYESNVSMMKNGNTVDMMYVAGDTNIYTIGSYGTFDPLNQTFTAFSSAPAGQVILYAHVRQYNNIYTYIININIIKYVEVERISLQNAVDGNRLNFSALSTEKSLIAYSLTKNATNPEITAFFEGGQISVEETIYTMFTQDGISIFESDGKYQITLRLSEEFIEKAEGYTNAISGSLIIVAKDWLDSGNNILSAYQDLAIIINIGYENGTVNNRFTLESAQDVLRMKDNLSAHYQIKTAVDISSISNELPLGVFKGSLIGLNEYSSITGISVTKGSDKHFGLFTEIDTNAYIEYVEFSGAINVQTNESSNYVGLLAGVNKGKLINISVSLQNSSVKLALVSTSNEMGGKVGAVVGENQGIIIQDFTLFESDDSVSKTEVYETEGRISYAGKTPKTLLYSREVFSVQTNTSTDKNASEIGGIAGKNTGTIQKIDSKVLSFIGYSNYFAYANIKATGHNIVGMIAGISTGTIQGGYNHVDESTNTYKIYENYSETDFEAGKGLVVGGEVSGKYLVGGVVGYIGSLTNESDFTGITVRTFVRLQAGGTQGAIIAPIASGINSVSSAFAVQAVDDGRTGEEASMLVIYSGSDYITDGVPLDKLCFGKDAQVTVMQTEKTETSQYKNVFSYLSSRNRIKKEENITLYLIESDKSIYYGDFVVVSTTQDGKKQVTQQAFFKYGNDENLSTVAKFDNVLSGSDNTNNTTIYYTYYFSVGSVGENNDISQAQLLLDKDFNKITSESEFYPFKANGEMTFVSKSTDILTIDVNGKITLKRTGLALVSATSLLNSNNALNFYIYVINYINTDKDLSIVYPNPSSSAVPLDDSIITLRGNNSATIYVVPDYKFDGEIKINKFGNGNIGGVAFNLDANNDITATVSILKSEAEYTGFDVNILGSIITIKSTKDTLEKVYNLEIQPEIYLDYLGNKYIANTNKKLVDTKLDYKYGATSINNEFYDEAVIHTSKQVVDNIIITSTDKDEAIPNFEITNALSGYYQNEAGGLFNVEIKKLTNSPVQNSQNEYVIKYQIKLTINKDSEEFINRYSQEIYGDYILSIISSSNDTIVKNIVLHYEKTNVSSIVVDNYNSIKEINETKRLSSASEYAFPGQSGMLAITINPEDSDFDYILIENDDQNYVSGHATANFGLLIRNTSENSESSENEFENKQIAGSATSKGLRLSQQDIINAYKNQIKYNGIVYIQYDMGANNVVDESVSKINISIIKNGEETFKASKNLRIKLQNFVTVTLEGKEGDFIQKDYYVAYDVARGLRYKLNINSYGFEDEDIELSISDGSLATLEKEGENYYLQITSNVIDYNTSSSLIIEAVASTVENEVTRFASSQTQIKIHEYVLNYNGQRVTNPDVVEKMDQGVINVQVGSQITFAIDLYDYIEYDSLNNEVITKINEFLTQLARKGKWTAYTNLISDTESNNASAPDPSAQAYTSGELKKYLLDASSNVMQSNYYFKHRGLNVIPTKTHEVKDNFYYFEFEVNFKADNGTYVVDNENTNNEANKVKTRFVLYVYTSSSEESPIPIYDYEDLISMQENSYYILLNDITLPSFADEGASLPAFSPIEGNFASLDGNGHSINFVGRYDMGSLSSLGLFKSLKEGTVVKNLNINYLASGETAVEDGDDVYALNNLKTTRFVTTAENFNFGSIAAENNGIITNCHVYTGENVYLTVKADNAINNMSFIAGIAGTNSGYITNSTAKINIQSPFYMSGIAGQNYGKIASCYFKEGKIINNSQFDQHVAGLVITNGENGQIISSYVAGTQTNTSLRSEDGSYYITSTVAGAGFVYENEGQIRDCYTDIDLSRTTGNMAGFAYYNSGSIKNSFSLSHLRNNVTASAGFVMFNSNKGVDGVIEDSYYYYAESINDQIITQSITGVERLDSEGFNNLANFEGYSYSSVMSTNAIWFVSTGATSDLFVDYIPQSSTYIIANSENDKLQTNTEYKTQNKVFARGRLELVSPNIEALSIRNFEYSEYDDETGNITYHYLDDTNAPNSGSLHNPRLINSAATMENYLMQESSASYINISSYRLISDIDYSDGFEGVSQLYKLTFAGILEGNGMKISQISMASMDRISNAGLFGQIGYSANRVGVVKDLIISPRQVAFPNANSVGTLAGTVQNGYIYDIKVEKIDENTNVSGLNFVGGVIGRAVTKFVMKDIYSDISVSSMYSSAKENVYSENVNNIAIFSYSGAIAGFVGNGELYNAHVKDVVTVMGSRAGFALGGSGRGSKINYVYVKFTQDAIIRAYHFGGFAVGEVSGELNHVVVDSNGATSIPFATVPRVPAAVGGIAGRLNGGKISNALMQQEFRVANSSSDAAIENVGGLVGQVSTVDNFTSYITDSIVTANIYAGATLGGCAGKVSSALVIESVGIKSSKLSVSGLMATPNVGGIVAVIENAGNAQLIMKNSYCWANIYVDTYVAGVTLTANVGGLIASNIGNRNVDLSYCYTTSKFDVIAYDLRAIGDVVDYSEFENSSSSSFKPKYYYNRKESSDRIERPINKDKDEVYFLGYSAAAPYSNITPYLSFKTKVKTTSVDLNVNNYGMSSYELAGNKQSTPTQSAQDLHNLYVGKFVGDVYGYHKLDYDVYGDKFLLASVEGTVKKVETFEKNPNNDDVYQSVSLYRTLSDNEKENFFKAGSGRVSYVYTGQESESGRTYESSFFIQFKQEGTNQVPDKVVSSRGNVYAISALKAGGKVDSDSPGGYSTNINTFTRYNQIKKSELLQQKVYKDADGNVYIPDMDEDSFVYTLAGDEFASLEGLNAKISELGLIEVWQLNPAGLSTLSMENTFDWINKI